MRSSASGKRSSKTPIRLERHLKRKAVGSMPANAPARSGRYGTVVNTAATTAAANANTNDSSAIALAVVRTPDCSISRVSELPALLCDTMRSIAGSGPSVDRASTLLCSAEGSSTGERSSSRRSSRRRSSIPGTYITAAYTPSTAPAPRMNTRTTGSSITAPP